MTDIEPFDWLASLMGSGIRPGLERMKALMGEIPVNRPFVTVAGTNGKGSTAATIDSILHASGLSTLLFTSPHLVDLRERWRIDGADVEIAELGDSIRHLRRIVRNVGITPTYFEALTLIAFLLAERRSVDVAVLEVGMGGRLDATNVVDADVAAISMVSFDHAEWLGSTIGEIAAEKAGILKRGTRGVTSNTDPVVLAALTNRAAEVEASLEQLEDRCRIAPEESVEGRTPFELDTPNGRYRLASPLRGDHQIRNVALAVRAAELFGETRGIRMSRPDVELGVAKARWRGRLEVHRMGERTLVIDGAHNEAGTETLARFIEMNLEGSTLLVFGCLRDKEIARMIGRIAPAVDGVVLTRVDSERAADPRDVRNLIDSAIDVEIVEPADDAIAGAWASDVTNVVVGGSLYLAGDAVRFVDERLRSDLDGVKLSPTVVTDHEEK